MNDPLVTIVITAYNYAALLPVAIGSAVRQTYQNLEILILDNASTDNTPQVVAPFTADARVRYVRNETNIGLTPNHNKGLREARGEYIVFLSADDLLMPDCVERSIEFFRRNPTIDLLYGNVIFMDIDGNLYGFRQMIGQPLSGYAGGRNELSCLLSEGCYMCTPTMVVHRRIYERYGEFDETFRGADWEITARWAHAGLTFGYDPEPFASVRLHLMQHSGFQMYSRTGGEVNEYLAIVERYLNVDEPHRYAGYENGIRRFLNGYRERLREVDEIPASGFNVRIDALHARVNEISARNVARSMQRVCYVIFSDTHPFSLTETLASLAAQTGEWQAVVMQRQGVGVESLCRLYDPGRRIRHIRTLAYINDGHLLNSTLRIEDADIYVLLRAGSTVQPGHADALRDAFAGRNVHSAFGRVNASVRAVPSPQSARERIAYGSSLDPAEIEDGPIPPETIAFTRVAFDIVGGFNGSIPALNEWEFFVRLHRLGGMVRTDAAVDITLWPNVSDTTIPFQQYNTLIDHIFGAFPVEGAALARRRRYAAALTRAQAAGYQSAENVTDFYATLQSALTMHA